MGTSLKPCSSTGKQTNRKSSSQLLIIDISRHANPACIGLSSYRFPKVQRCLICTLPIPSKLCMRWFTHTEYLPRAAALARFIAASLGEHVFFCLLLSLVMRDVLACELC